MESKAPPRSFNTVKNSNREQRAKRQKKERLVLLSIALVACLLAVSLFLFGVCSIVNALTQRGGNDPQGAQARVEITYTSATKSNADLHTGDLIVVSEKEQLSYLFPATPNLVLIEDLRQDQNGVRPYTTRRLREDEKLLSDAAYAANRMLTDYYLATTDSSLIFMDAYRTAADQEDYSSTPVGFSEHHTGLVFTIRTYNANNKPVPLENNPVADKWISENAYKYGIVCRYPTGKEDVTGVSGYNYCFRYVGVAHATYMQRNNLCLEEYLDLLKSNYSNGSALEIVDGETSYSVYYVPASAEELTTVAVPKNYRYTVSGDNEGGFIVTVFCNEPTE